MWNYVLYFRNNSTKADKLINFIKENEQRDRFGRIINIKETNEKVMNYIKELTKDDLNVN